MSDFPSGTCSSCHEEIHRHAAIDYMGETVRHKNRSECLFALKTRNLDLRQRAERAEADEKFTKAFSSQYLFERDRARSELEAAQSTIADLNGQVERMREAIAEYVMWVNAHLHCPTEENGERLDIAHEQLRAALGGAE